jgi:hypothetical protein
MIILSVVLQLQTSSSAPSDRMVLMTSVSSVFLHTGGPDPPTCCGHYLRCQLMPNSLVSMVLACPASCRGSGSSCPWSSTVFHGLANACRLILLQAYHVRPVGLRRILPPGSAWSCCCCPTVLAAFPSSCSCRCSSACMASTRQSLNRGNYSSEC